MVLAVVKLLLLVVLLLLLLPAGLCAPFSCYLLVLLYSSSLLLPAKCLCKSAHFVSGEIASASGNFVNYDSGPSRVAKGSPPRDGKGREGGRR